MKVMCCHSHLVCGTPSLYSYLFISKNVFCDLFPFVFGGGGGLEGHGCTAAAC